MAHFQTRESLKCEPWEHSQHNGKIQNLRTGPPPVATTVFCFYEVPQDKALPPK